MRQALQKLLRTIHPGTYVRPKRCHAESHTLALVVVSGAMDFVVFDEGGGVVEARALRADDSDLTYCRPSSGMATDGHLPAMPLAMK